MNIGHMIVWLIWKKERNPHLDPSITCCRTNFWFWKYIDENFMKGFIWHSKSPIGVLILFVKKKDASICMCVNYHGLNRLTITNHYALPLISRLLDQLSDAKKYTKIDLRGTYNLVCIQEGDEWKTVFRTYYGHFEYVMTPICFTNAPIVFQHMMNDVFHEYLDDFVAITLMTSSFSQKTWQTTNAMYVLF